MLGVEPFEVEWDANQECLVVQDEGRVVTAQVVEREGPLRTLAALGVIRERAGCVSVLPALSECLVLPAKACYSV